MNTNVTRQLAQFSKLNCVLVFFLFTFTLGAQTDLGSRPAPGVKVWVSDVNGWPVRANLDPATLVLDPPATAGARPTLRVIVPPAQGAAPVRMKVVSFTYAGIPFQLPDAPAANTTPLLFWSANFQDPSNFTLSGQILTLVGNWQVNDRVTIVYFY